MGSLNSPTSALAGSEFTEAFLLNPDTPEASTIISGIAFVHAHCILHDATLATFMPPLSGAKLTTYWSDRLKQVEQESRRIIVQLRPIAARTLQRDEVAKVVYAADSQDEISAPVIRINIEGRQENYEVAGFVSLWKPESETGPFRADVEKLLVSPYHRRRGIARSLMRLLEATARKDGRWSLLLDTTVGSEAEHVYPRLGYEAMGVVKNHGFNVRKWLDAGCQGDKEYVDELWFKKNLKISDEL